MRDPFLPFLEKEPEVPLNPGAYRFSPRKRILVLVQGNSESLVGGTSSWRLQTLNPCKACTKPICNVPTPRKRSRFLWADLPRSCLLLLMVQGVSHVCPYWEGGYCLYEGPGACFLFEAKRRPQNPHFSRWLRYRSEVGSYLRAISSRKDIPRMGVPPLSSSAESEPRKKLCPFASLSDPKRTLFSSEASALEAYEKGWIPTALEVFRGAGRGDAAGVCWTWREPGPGSTDIRDAVPGEVLRILKRSRQKDLSRILEFIESEENRMDGF